MTRLNDGDELEIASETDFGISRGTDGELLPVKQRIPGTDKAIKVVPVSAGAREEYADVLEGRSDDEERVAELWNEHVVEGPGTDVSPDDIRARFPYGLVAGINQALKNSSGEDVFSAVQEQQATTMKRQVKMMGDVREANPELVDQIAEDAVDEASNSNDKQQQK